MLVRISEPGKPAFQWRKGEHGISVFDRDGIDPPLGDEELLEVFREGRVLVERTTQDIEAHGLIVVPISGAPSLPVRRQTAHAEIRCSSGMARNEFQKRLTELE